MLVTLQELKDHLRIEHPEEDVQLTLLLRVAQASAEDFCKTCFKRSVPEPVRLAILLHASHFYTNRESNSVEAYSAMVKAFRALLWPYRNTEKLV